MLLYLILKRLLSYSPPAQPPPHSPHRPENGGTARPASHSDEGEEMVEDPYCKVYVPVNGSVVRTIGGVRHHFCSEECAGKYVKELR